MKKFTAILMVCLLCLSFLLTACGNNATKETTEATEAATETTTETVETYPDEYYYDFGGPLDEEYEEGEPDYIYDPGYSPDDGSVDIPEETVYEDIDVPDITEAPVDEIPEDTTVTG